MKIKNNELVYQFRQNKQLYKKNKSMKLNNLMLKLLLKQ